MAREPFDLWSPKFRDALGRFAAVRDGVLDLVRLEAEKAARSYAPSKTGELRASIRGLLEGTGTGRSVRGPRVFLTAPRKYAPIEFGSRRGHRAQRFLERGMGDAADYAEREMADEIASLLTGKAGHIGPRFSGRRLGSSQLRLFGGR